MIYDGLGQIGLYRGLFRGLDVLIDWLDENDLNDLPLGRTEILGKKVFINKMNANTRTFENGRFETHRRYMDVQIDLKGAENFKTTPGEIAYTGEFDVEGDKGFGHETPDNHDLIDGTLKNGHFALFMIGEAHMPNLVCDGAEPGTIEKVCVKILGDQFWDED